MTIAKITGNGWEYLVRHTAHGDIDPQSGEAGKPGVRDKAAYYAASGSPPGRWAGRGAHLLGLQGKEVTVEQMRALYGQGMHPDADAMITAYATEHHTPGMTAAQLKELQKKAIRHATLGRSFPRYEPLDEYGTRVERRLQAITQETGRDPTTAEVKQVKAQEARRQRAAVAGFDLVFSPVKSAALLWAVDERPKIRDAVRQAHERAIGEAMAYLEDEAAWTRTGAGGIAQIDTSGLIAAAFEHHDSRAGDPCLHTHVAVSSKIQGSDGRWRSLDARALYRLAVSASELYNTAFENQLSALTGVTFEDRPGTGNGREPIREIAGIPATMIAHFSKRRAQIEAKYAELVRDYRKAHGHDPSLSTSHKLAQQASYDTRTGKKPPSSLEDKRDRWRAELTGRFGPHAVEQIMRAVPAAAPADVRVSAPDLHNMAERLVASVASRRSTWTQWNIRAEAERLLRMEAPGMSPDQHADWADMLTDLALFSGPSVCVEAPAVTDAPKELCRADGESVFTEHGAGRYTSKAVLSEEQRLLDATRTPTVNGLAGSSVAAALDGFEGISGRELDPRQRALVTTFATDDRLLLAGLGPAGAGKTTAMRAYAHVLRQHGRRIVPLAASAAAADILGKELRLPAENLHKFVYEWTAGRAAAKLRAGEPVPAALRKFALNPGDVILVDEAGMAGTFLLGQVVTLATSRGATVRLLGDDRQLSAVESGGALRLVAIQPGTPELTVLHRFRNPEEAEATLKIRSGDGTAVEWYNASNRIVGGSLEAVTEAAYEGWKTDMLAGKTTLMAAGDGRDVTALSAQARADRIAAGQVEAEGVTLRDGNRAGAGDWIVTRENSRRMSTHGGRDWVKNGDSWHVERRHEDGSLTVRSLTHDGRVTLPPEYVATHVQLLYATTVHRAQGSTVDTAHPLITAGMTREMLYVLASRARDKTTLYVATHDLPFDEDKHVDQVRVDEDSYAAREVLLNVIATEGAALSATETIEVALDEAESLATLVPEYQHAAHEHAEGRYLQAAAEAFGEGTESLTADEAWHAVTRRLYEAEAAGWDPAKLLVIAKDTRELDTADSLGEVISWRIDRILEHSPRPPRDGKAYETPAVTGDRLATIATAILGVRTAEMARAECAWPALIAALHRAENAGLDAPSVLTETANSREVRTAENISEALSLQINHRLENHPSDRNRSTATAPATRSATLLPWVTAPHRDRDGESGMPEYLNGTSELIEARVKALTEVATEERPAWMSMLGQSPEDEQSRQAWLGQVAIIAAYRDQLRVTVNDAHQVLGPYPGSSHAGYKAYWHATESVLKARRLSGLDQSPHMTQHGPDITDTQAVARAQTATDIYRGLAQAERAEIASEVAARAGILWFGDRLSPDEDAAVQRAYSDLLTAELTARGHLTSQATRLSNPRTAEPVEAHFARRHEAENSSRRPRRTSVSRATAPTEIPSQQRIPRVDKHPGLQLPQQQPPVPRTRPGAPAPSR